MNVRVHSDEGIHKFNVSCRTSLEFLRKVIGMQNTYPREIRKLRMTSNALYNKTVTRKAVGDDDRPMDLVYAIPRMYRYELT